MKAWDELCGEQAGNVQALERFKPAAKWRPSARIYRYEIAGMRDESCFFSLYGIAS